MFFVDNFLSHENLFQKKIQPKNIICSKASKLPFRRVKLHHMDREKMHINLPYLNIFTRKKNYTFFFVFVIFFLKNQFFDIFSSFGFRKDFKTGGSKKSHSDSIKLVQKPDSNFFQKILCRIYLHNYLMNDTKITSA